MAGLAGAQPAQARETGTAGRVWQWVQEAWQLSGLTLWTRPAAPAGTRRSMEKEGWGLDPNGKPAPVPPEELCAYCGDSAASIDPNG